MEDSRPVGTPMSTGHKISKEIYQITHISMIGKLKYVVHTRPDIALIVGMVARFFDSPK